MLAGRNVALGVTGSIAAVRTVELAHELRRNGANVRAITTDAAESIIHPWSLEYATDRPVITEITGSVEHVELCGYDGWADVLLIAPATANTIGKLAASIDDTPVTTCATTAIGADLPVVIAPAMHQPMYEHDGVLDALDTLRDWGVHPVAPRHEEGKAKIASDEAIVTAVARAIGPDDLADHHVIVTSGATSEPVDAVRVLTNRSSGKMGRAIARDCARRGADVTVIHDGPDIPYATVEPIETGTEMRETAVDLADQADALISAAAIGDFHIDTVAEKLDSRDPVQLELEPAPKLLDAVRDATSGLSIVGFKAEHGSSPEQMAEEARSLQDRIDAAFIVANDASVMGTDETEALLVDGPDVEQVQATKADLAIRISDRLVEHLAA